MPKLRVLIVDDAVVVRNRLTKLISSDPELEVVGVAATGHIALAKIPQVNPNVVILDLEMPDLDGLETLAIIRQRYPQLPVIMFSTFTWTGAKATLDALALGASDYATKPSQFGNVEAANQHILETLIPKIKGIGFRTSPPIPQQSFSKKVITSPRAEIAALEVVAIGVSTGGPNALTQMLPAFPADFPVPILIVQHMPPMFTKLLAEQLSAKSHLQVEEAIPGMRLVPGTAWIAPGDYHMIAKRDGETVRLAIHQAPPQNSCRPSVDVLFDSIAQVYGPRSLGVVLTGMGQDGLRGCASIREAGGQILAQDEPSSVVWGMPGFVVNAGLADAVVSIEEMAGEILRRTGRPQSRS